MPKLININTYHYRRGGSDVVYFEHANLMQQQGFENAYFANASPQEWANPGVDFY